MWRQRCCLYSVRSYIPGGSAGEGLTQWTADYWRGSTGAYLPSVIRTGAIGPQGGDVLRVAVDASGDVYVAGPAATSSTDGSRWNVVKYDGATGAEIWKVLQPIDVPFNPSTTGNCWSIVFNPTDGKLYLHGDYRSITTPSPGVSILHTDGTNGGAFVVGANASSSNSLAWDGSQVIRMPYDHTFGPDALPFYQAFAGGNLATIGAVSSPNWTINPAAAVHAYPGMVSAPLHSYFLQHFSSYPNYGPVAMDFIDGGSDQLLAVSATPIYFSSLADTSLWALIDTGVDTGLPVTARWRDSARQPTLLKFQDSAYLVVISVTSPKTMLTRTSDGSKEWGHNHLDVTGIAVDATAIVTVGGRKSKLGDQDFV